MAAKSTSTPIRKTHYRWLYYSVAVVLAWLFLFVFEVAGFSIFIRDLPTPFRIAAVIVPLIAAFGLLLALLMGNKMVPWRYGVFGPYECSPRPKAFHPRICIRDVPRRPQHATCYEVGEEGIELTFLFGSRAFIPAEMITAIGPATSQLFGVEHDSPEVGSPLIVSKQVGEAILAGLGRPGSKI